MVSVDVVACEPWSCPFPAAKAARLSLVCLGPAIYTTYFTLPDRFPEDELETYSFLAPSDALPLLDLHLHRRVTHALVALTKGITIYLEDGCIP